MSGMSDEERHQIIRAKGLEDKNYAQASKIMELEHLVRKLRIDTAKIMLVERYDKMSQTEDMTPDEEGGDVVPFRKPELSVITGGRDGGGSNWLSNLDEGCVFLSHPKGRKADDDNVEQWHLQVKWKKCAILYQSVPRDGMKLTDMESFSKLNQLVEIIRKKAVEMDND